MFDYINFYYHWVIGLGFWNMRRNPFKAGQQGLFIKVLRMRRKKRRKAMAAGPDKIKPERVKPNKAEPNKVKLAPGVEVVKYSKEPRRKHPHIALIFLIIIILILISFAPAVIRENSEPHTNLFFIDMKDYPKYSDKGNAVDFSFRIENKEKEEKTYGVRMTIDYMGGAQEIGHEMLNDIDEFQTDYPEDLTKLKDIIANLEKNPIGIIEFLELLDNETTLKGQAEDFLEHYNSKERTEVIDEFKTRISRQMRKTFYKQAVMNQDFEKARVTVELDSGESISFWTYATDSLYHYRDIGYRSVRCIPDATDINWQEDGRILFRQEQSRIENDHTLRLFVDGTEVESDLSGPAAAKLGQGYHVIDLVLEYDAQIPIDINRYFELISANVNGRDIPASSIIIDLGRMPYALDCNDAFGNELRLYEAGAYRFKVRII